MTPITSWRRLLGAAGIVALGFVLAAPPATAVEPTAVGWWWAGRPSGTLPGLLSPAPDPPKGGLYVAGGPSGPTGISALRFQTDPDATAVTLTLRIAETQGIPAIDACVAAAGWEPAENGSWDQRPEDTCDTNTVTGSLDPDGTELSFAVSSLEENGVIDIVLVPGDDPATDSPAIFSVAFEPPGDDALTVTEPIATGTSSPDTAATETAPPARRAEPTPTPTPTPALPLTRPVPPAPAATATNESETTRTDVASSQPTTASGFIDSDDFAYPAVLFLPLALLVASSYVGWALTRSVTVRGHHSQHKQAWA